jgi:long-chain acyl-CoA synthetase
MNVASIIENHDAQSTALISRGRATTFGALRDQVASLRGSFNSMGVGKGDVVALLCGNSRYFVVSYLAALGVGAVVAPLNLTSPAPEIEGELNAIAPKVVVVEPSAAAAWNQLSSSTRSSVQVVIATEGHNIDGAHTLDNLLVGAPAPMVDMDAADHAAYMFTSGTAGAPKAAILTHGNLLSNIEQAQDAEHIGPTDVTMCVLPLFHIFGLNVTLGTTLSGGGCVVLVQRFDPVSALETIRDRNVTILPGAPSMWSSFAQMDGISSDAFSTVRIALSGAARLGEQVAQSLATRFGLKVYEGYGLTEASPVVSTSIDLPWTPGSIGKPVINCSVRLVDENGDDALTGDPGEIWVKGPNVFAGYLNNPEATANVLDSSSWLHTGDIGVVDENGHLYIVDRSKDLIIVSGFNVFPAEVEGIIAEHDGVADVAVVGTAHPHTGEAVRAYVVLKPGVHLDEDALVDFCRSRLARYKCPSKVLFVDSIPRNLSGKVKRFALHG